MDRLTVCFRYKIQDVVFSHTRTVLLKLCCLAKGVS